MRVSGRTTWAALVAGGLLVGCYGDVPSAPSEPVISIGPAALPDPIASPAEPDPTPEVVLDPGRVTIRRLNRAEYDNTVRDLLGVAIAPAADFPSDDHSYGFDNIADVLAMSPVLMELYERAAGRLVAEALRVPLLTMWDSQVLAEEADDVAGLPYDGFGVLMFSPDARVTHTFDVPLDGRYSLSVVAWGQPLADELPIMSVKVDQKEVATAPVAELEEQPGEYVFELDLSEGSRQLSITLANGTVIGAGELLVLGVATLRLTGPVDFVSPPAGWVSPRDRLLVCAPVSDSDADAAACARQILEALASRAWRRPVTDADMTRLMALYEEASEEGLDFEAAVAMALRAVLVSPFFIFRVEVDADPTSLEPHPLNDHELATRLSYFLWSSAPDEELPHHALVGGLAVSIHATPRATEDIDLIIRPEDLSRCAEVLGPLGYRSLSAPMRLAAGRVEIHRLTHLDEDDFVVLDLLLATDAKLLSVLDGRVEVQVEGKALWLSSWEGLCLLKRLRGSPQDLADLAALGAEPSEGQGP